LPAASVTLAFLTSSAAERTHSNSQASAVVEILLMNASTDGSISRLYHFGVGWTSSMLPHYLNEGVVGQFCRAADEGTRTSVLGDVRSVSHS